MNWAGNQIRHTIQISDRQCLNFLFIMNCIDGFALKKKTEYDKIYFCHHIMFTTLGKLFFCSGLSAQGQNLGNEGNVQI